jgi:hypothetical protein
MQVTDPTPAPETTDSPAPEVEEREQSFEDFEAEMAGKPAASAAPASDDPPADPPPAPEEKPAKQERPFKRILAATAQTNAELERLRAENARLAAMVPAVPPAPAQPPADASTDQYGAKAQPMPEDFEKDGTFDAKAYMAAFGAWNRAEALREVDRREAAKTTANQAQAEETEIRTAAQTWQSQAQELAKEDPEIGEAIAFMRRNDVACYIPEKVQIQLLRVNPLVSVAIASRQDLLDVMQSGNETEALRLIGRIEGVLEMATARAQTPAAEVPQAPRAPDGRFAPPPPRAPVPKPAPRGPVDLGGGGTASVSPIDMDFKTYEKHMDAQSRRR